MGSSWKAVLVMLGAAVISPPVIVLGAHATSAMAQVLLLTWGIVPACVGAGAGFWLVAQYDHDWSWERRRCRSCEGHKRDVIAARKEAQELREALATLQLPESNQ